MTIRDNFRTKPKTVFSFKLYLNPEDVSHVGVSIGTRGWLNLPLTQLLLKLTKPGMNVIDIGANIGYYTLLFASKVGPTGRVLAYEPEALNYEFLVRSVAENAFSNVITTKMAVGDVEGMIVLHLSSRSHPEAHSIIYNREGPSVEISCTTLDHVAESLNAARIDVMKIHVGGAEPMVLQGGMKMISALRPMIITVYGAEAWKDSTNLLSRLTEMYDLYEVVPRPWLVKRITETQLSNRKWVELFLRPKS